MKKHLLIALGLLLAVCAEARIVKLNKQRSDSGDDGAICCKGNATIILKDTNAIYVDCQGAEGIYIPQESNGNYQR